MEQEEERVRTITFKIQKELLALLNDYATKHSLSRSEIIRWALVEFLARNGYKKEIEIILPRLRLPQLTKKESKKED